MSRMPTSPLPCLCSRAFVSCVFETPESIQLAPASPMLSVSLPYWFSCAFASCSFKRIRKCSAAACFTDAVITAYMLVFVCVCFHSVSKHHKVFNWLPHLIIASVLMFMCICPMMLRIIGSISLVPTSPMPSSSLEYWCLCVWITCLLKTPGNIKHSLSSLVPSSFACKLDFREHLFPVL